MGRTLGQADDPLLVSVRSGAKFSMPGMMETVLNVGLNDESVEGLAKISGSDRVRLGLLPAAAVDVRRDGARRRAVERSTRRSTRSRRARRRRPTSTSTPTTSESWSRRTRTIIAERDRRRVPAVAARAARPGGRGGLRVLEHRPREDLPAARADPRRPRHRRQHRARWSSATSATTPGPASASPATRRAATRACTATTSPTPRARTSWRASATPCR